MFFFCGSSLKSYSDSTHFRCKNFPTLMLTFCVKLAQGNPNPMVQFFAEGTGQLNSSTCLNILYIIMCVVFAVCFLISCISYKEATDSKTVWSFSLSPSLVFVLSQFLSFLCMLSAIQNVKV